MNDSDNALVVPPEDARGLIKQNSRERLLTKLKGFRENDLTAKERFELDDVEREFVEYFLDLRWRMVGVSRDQLKTLDEEEVRELAGVLYERARTAAFLQKAFTFVVPVVGWMVGIGLYFETHTNRNTNVCTNSFRSWRYRRLYQKLRNAYGEKYSPHKALMARLEEIR